MAKQLFTPLDSHTELTFDVFKDLDLSEEIRNFLEEARDKHRLTKLKNGAIYVGEWLNRLRHGKGFCLFPDKSFYFGEWANGESSGNGMLVNQDKTMLQGTWANNKMNG